MQVFLHAGSGSFCRMPDLAIFAARGGPLINIFFGGILHVFKIGGILHAHVFANRWDLQDAAFAAF